MGTPENIIKACRGKGTILGRMEGGDGGHDLPDYFWASLQDRFRSATTPPGKPGGNSDSLQETIPPAQTRSGNMDERGSPGSGKGKAFQ